MKHLKENLVHYDQESDALYLGVKQGAEEEFREVAPGVHVELNKKGDVIGIEILDASRALKPYFTPQRHTRMRRLTRAVAA